MRSKIFQKYCCQIYSKCIMLLSIKQKVNMTVGMQWCGVQEGVEQSNMQEENVILMIRLIITAAPISHADPDC